MVPERELRLLEKDLPAACSLEGSAIRERIELRSSRESPTSLKKIADRVRYAESGEENRCAPLS
jgi:hypothetical protein